MKPHSQALKWAGGALIVGAAACIVLPGLVGYLAGLWRLLVMIALVIAAAWGMSFLYARLSVRKQGKGN